MKFEKLAESLSHKKVAPFAGAWIEILALLSITPLLPVAPFAGAWIEIRKYMLAIKQFDDVAPFAGAWIEIVGKSKLLETMRMSLPSRERGLKYV